MTSGRRHRLPCAALLLAWLLLDASLAGATAVYRYRGGNRELVYTDEAPPAARRPAGSIGTADPAVRLERRALGSGEALWLRNESSAPVEVDVQLESLGNVAGRPQTVLHRVLPPRSFTSLLSLQPADPSRPVRYTPRLRFALGDPHRQPDGSAYAVPWRGGPFAQSQGANGHFSHFTPRNRHAVDIAMPIGTPVLAARAGTVLKIDNSQTGRGGRPSGNFVRILHDDGTMSVYLHLQPGSVAVREGQRVAAGNPIARSGNTGNSTGPHLHFVVQRNVGMALESIPFHFARSPWPAPRLALGGR